MIRTGFLLNVLTKHKIPDDANGQTFASPYAPCRSTSREPPERTKCWIATDLRENIVSGHAASFDVRQSGLSCNMMDLFRRLLCLLGFHDFRVVEVTMGFGSSGTVEKVECRRCGRSTARRSRET